MSCVRWSQGLIFHQAVVDCARAAILLPMGRSIFLCEAISKCALVETTFLLLVTVSTVNLLTTVLNDAPILPDEDSEDTISLLKDSPQCVSFGLFMIWLVSATGLCLEAILCKYFRFLPTPCLQQHHYPLITKAKNKVL